MPSTNKSRTIVFEGKMSTFGGPDDTGVTADEGLALVSDHNRSSVAEYFLPEQPKGTTGLARRLNPKTFYIACRWDYKVMSQAELLKSMVRVTSVVDGKDVKSALAKPMDWGPALKTGRVADLSPGLAESLGLKTDDIVRVEFPADEA